MIRLMISDLVVVVFIQLMVVLKKFIGVDNNLNIEFENLGKYILNDLLVVDWVIIDNMIRLGMMNDLQVMFLIFWMWLLMVVLKMIKYRVVEMIGVSRFW